ncbi:hypothetical protein GGS20DRAFT_480669 [Poronia punctata]|nr:hypothetical protein GGS20DRAFT_480669 [Poronia punctata]
MSTLFFVRLLFQDVISFHTIADTARHNFRHCSSPPVYLRPQNFHFTHSLFSPPESYNPPLDMMETSTNSATASEGQIRKRKGRNSDIRKEQNRIASRAYREKRKQKLALLDEILKSDSQNDSMSSVSDETEYNPTTPAPDFVGLDIGRSKQSSHSPAPSFYLSAAPVLGTVPAVAAGVQPLPSNGPSRNTGAYAGYPVDGYAREHEGMHAEYAHDPIISTVGLSPGYAPDHHQSMAQMPPTPLFSFEDEFLGEFPGTYNLPDGSVVGSSAPGYDPNILNALHSISRLNDHQQEEILVFLQKKRSLVQSSVADRPYGLGYGDVQVPIPRSSPVPFRPHDGNHMIHHDGRLPGRYSPKQHR